MTGTKGGFDNAYFLKKVNDAVHIPVPRSLRANSCRFRASIFVDVFEQTNVDAALAASVLSLWRDIDT